jgi:hypothetical protein
MGLGLLKTFRAMGDASQTIGSEVDVLRKKTDLE